METVFLRGFATSAALIVAIGAQNAFVLRQGLRREHVGSVVLFCAVADAVLMAAGVLGMAQALGRSPGLARALAFAGALFLAAYGWQALRRARQPHRLKAAAGGEGLRRGAAVAQAAAFTLLNPHVYLDTVLLVGGLGCRRGWGGTPSADSEGHFRAARSRCDLHGSVFRDRRRKAARHLGRACRCLRCAAAGAQGQAAQSPGTLPTSSRKFSNGPMLPMASIFGPAKFRRPNIMAFMGPYSPVPISRQRGVSAHIR